MFKKESEKQEFQEFIDATAKKIKDSYNWVPNNTRRPILESSFPSPFEGAYRQICFDIAQDLLNNTFGDFPQDKMPNILPPPAKKCECGAESLGYMTHSPWCQKHEK